MAKFYGNIVKVGRLGGSVFRIRGGETIESQYQPAVANPNTEGQVKVRAQFKLLSQLATVMAPVIAIPRVGNQSSRNLFVSRNYRLSTYSGVNANIDLLGVQLTASVVAFPSIGAERSQSGITVSLADPAAVGALNVNRVVYALFAKRGTELRFVDTRVATSAGSSNLWAPTQPFPLINEGFIVYAYGIRDNNEKASAIFGNMTVPSGQTIAQLIVQRTLAEADITLTETSSIQVGQAG